MSLITSSSTGSEFTPRRFAVLLGVLVIVAFGSVIFGSETFVFRDYGYFGFPLAHYFRESIFRGEIPLWNPLSYCGSPFLAQWNTQVLYPFAYFYILFPPAWALGVFCVAHLFFGGLGMYRLACRWTSNDWAAAIAGVAYAFNGLNLNCLDWPNNIAALGWMPWVALMFEDAVRSGDRKIIFTSLAGAMQMLTGAPEVVIFTWICAPVIALPSVLREKTIGRAALRMLAILAIVAALAAAQLFSFLDLLMHSHRDRNFADDAWAMPLTGWVNFLFPLFQNHLSFHGVYVQHGQYWTTSYYAGAAVFLIAVWACFVRRDLLTRLLAGLLLFSLITALGKSGHVFPALAKYVPIFGMMRFPIKFVIIANFVLPLLAAIGVSSLEKGGEEGQRNGNKGMEMKPLSLVVLIGMGLGVLALWFGSRNPFPNDDWSLTWSNSWTRIGGVVLILGGVWGGHRCASERARMVLKFATVILLTLDLLKHAPPHPTVDRAVYTVPIPRGTQMPSPGEGRAMISAFAHDELSHSSISNTVSDYASRRFTLYSDCNLIDNIPKLDGFFSLYLKEEYEVRSLLYAYTNSVAPRLLDFLGVTTVTSRTNIFDWTRRATALPFITGGQKPVFAEPGAIVAALRSNSFDPAHDVYLRPQDRGKLTGTNNAIVKISSSRISAHRVECDVDSNATSLITIAQANYHCWRATVNGVPVPILKANHAFQAVPIPKGRSHIVLRYHDSAFIAGCDVSIFALVAGGVLLVRARRP